MADWSEAGSVRDLVPPARSTPPPLKPTGPVKPPNPVTAISDDAVGSVAGSPPRQPWYCHWAVLTLTTLAVFPATWVLVWWKSTYSKRAKWAWTVAACIMAALRISYETGKDVAPTVPQASSVKSPDPGGSSPQAGEPRAAMPDSRSEPSQRTTSRRTQHAEDSPATKSVLEELRRNGSLTPTSEDTVRRSMEIFEKNRR